MTVKSQNQCESLEIRPIRPADAEGLRALYALSLRRNAQGFIQNLQYHGDIAERAAAYQSGNGAMLGVFTNDNLVGMGGLKRKDAERVELGNLHLHPEYHGCGIGKKLSLALLEQAKKLGYSVVELHVTATQEAAIGLYKRLGFVQTDRRVYDVEGQSFDTIFMELRDAVTT